ncbi:MAG: DUF4388 domain-containing protein [Sandaracinaceae bacterium]
MSSRSITDGPASADPSRQLLAAALEDAVDLAEGLGAAAAGRSGAASPGLVGVSALRAGLEAAAVGDYLAAADDFHVLVLDGDPQLRLIGRLWCARALLGAGRLEAAFTVRRGAPEEAASLGELASVALRLLSAEQLAAAGDIGRALHEVGRAEAGYRALALRRGLGAATLLSARLLAALGQEEEAADAACRALASDRTRPCALVFLARRALRDGERDRAERILARGAVLERDEIGVEADLVELLAEPVLPDNDLRTYVDVADAAPTASVLQTIEQLVHRSPECVPLRALLADRSLQVGRFSEAERHFAWLAARSLPPSLRRRVRRAQGVLADRAADAARAGSHPPPQTARLGEVSTGALRSLFEDEGLARDSQLRLELLARSKVLEGRLEHVPFPHLLGFLSSGRSTGTLVLRSEDQVGSVDLAEGRITGASSPGCCGLGPMLVRAGALTPEELEVAKAARQRQPERSLAEVLDNLAFVDAESLRDVLVRQVHEAVLEMMTWATGAFGFAPESLEGPRPGGSVGIALNPEHVLLEAARSLDEAAPRGRG